MMSNKAEQLQRFLSNTGDRMIGDDGWFDLSMVWSVLEDLGSERDSQKKKYQSTKNWSKHSTHFIGLVGETTVSIATGIPLNLVLDPAGDGCRDFTWEGKTLDVKGTIYWRNPHLKQYPKPKRWCDYLVLVGIDPIRQASTICGWATADEMKTANLVDYGHGPQLSINGDDLHKGLPPFLPVRAKEVPS